MGALVSAIAFPHPPRDMTSRALKKRKDLIYLTTSAGDTIPAIYIQKQQNSNNNFTILYSHGNAEDIGLLIPYIEYMSEICHCSVLAYEYPGYSIAEGIPSEENCYSAIRAAYQYLIEQNDNAYIVLFGRSLGSGPTIDLCSQLDHDRKEIVGCILQSPLESGIRAFLGYASSRTLYYLDIFRSYEKIPAINCPVFIIHGENDNVVPCANGKEIYNSLRQKQQQRISTSNQNNNNNSNNDIMNLHYPPCWIPGRGHNDMPEYECLQKCRLFLNFLMERESIKQRHHQQQQRQPR